MLEVGIPIYHSLKTLPKALDSLVAQTKSMFITCLSIDGDGEDYSEIINTYQDRGLHIRVINSEINCGPGMARQRVIDTTQCDYIAFLDSDDMFLPRAVEILYSEAKAHDYNILSSDFIRESKGTDSSLMEAKNRGCTWFHGSVYKVSYLRENNIRFDPFLRTEEDAYFNLVSYNFTSNRGTLKEITYLWRDNPDSLTRHGSLKEYYLRSSNNYTYSQIKGLKKIFKLKGEVSDCLLSQTIPNLYIHYMKGKFYKMDLSIMENYLSELKEEIWFQNFLAKGENWLEMLRILPAGDFIDNEAIVFYEETFDKWIKRLLKNENYSN